MTLSSELTTEQIAVAQAWVHDYYKAFDSFDIDHWLNEFHTPDIVLNLGNTPTIKGFQDIQTHFKQQNACLSSIKHTMVYIDVLSDRIYVQNNSTFMVKNDPERKKIKFNAICVFWKNIDAKKVSSINVYFDPTPLVERIQLVANMNT